MKNAEKQDLHLSDLRVFLKVTKEYKLANCYTILVFFNLSWSLSNNKVFQFRTVVTLTVEVQHGWRLHRLKLFIRSGVLLSLYCLKSLSLRNRWIFISIDVTSTVL